MSKTRDTGFLANVIQVHDTGVRIMSGSTMLMAVSSSGQVTITGELSGSDAANSLLLDGTGSLAFTTTASFLVVSASQQQISSSLLQVSASYIALSGSYNTFSGSASTRITENSSSIQQVSSSQQQISSSLLQVSASYISLSGSYTTFSGSASTRVTQIEQVYATTGSNSFRANQSITGSLVVSSTITAQTLIVQTVTSSIVYSSGSNNFGCDLNSRQTFTGSFFQTGSLASFSGQVCVGSSLVLGTNNAYALYLKDSAGNPKPVMATAGNTNLNFYNVCSTGKININNAADNAVLMSIDNTGAACFASTVCAPSAVFSKAADQVIRVETTSATDNSRIDFITPSKCYTIQNLQTGAANALIFYDLSASAERMRITSAGNVGIGASPAPVYNLEVSSTGGSQRIRVGTLQNNDNTPRFEAITSNGISVANSAWLKVNDAGGFALGQSDYTKAGGDSGNFACISSEAEYPRINVASDGRVGINVSPAASTIFHVQDNAARSAVYRFEPCTNAYESKLIISSRSSGDGGIRYGCGGGNDMNIFSYSTMRFNVGSGNIGGNVTCERLSINSDGIATFACQVCSKRFIGSSTIAFGGLITGTQSTACQSIESLWALSSNRSTAVKGSQYGNGTWYIQGYTSAGNWIYYKFMIHDPVWFRAYVYLANYADTSLRKGCLQYSLDNSATWVDLANATNWLYSGTLDGSIALSGDSKYITLRWDSGGGASSLVGWNSVEFTACGSAFYSVNGLG